MQIKSKIGLFLVLLMAITGCAAAGDTEINITENNQVIENTPVTIPTELPDATITLTTPTTDGEALEGSRDADAIPLFQPGDEIIPARISMHDEQNGWMITSNEFQDQHLLHTSDGGITWGDVTPPEPASESSIKQIAASFYLNKDHAWLSYANTYPPGENPAAIWFTTDGGVSWSANQSMDVSGLEMEMSSAHLITFIDSKLGWLVTAHGAAAGSAPVSIYQTQDGGENWNRIRDPFSEDDGTIDVCCQTGIAFLDGSTGLITGGFGAMSQAYINWSRDGGATWEFQTLPIPDPDLVEFGMCGTKYPHSFPPSTVVLLAECINPDLPPGETIPYLFITENAGETWNVKNMPVIGLEDMGMPYSRREIALNMLTPLSGWLVYTDIHESEDGNEQIYVSRLYQTTNGGSDWQLIQTIDRSSQVSFIDEITGWAILRDQQEINLMQTITGAKSWIQLPFELAP